MMSSRSLYHSAPNPPFVTVLLLAARRGFAARAKRRQPKLLLLQTKSSGGRDLDFGTAANKPRLSSKYIG